ncbi:MAG: phosphoenolpyruvate--protein phosphotransferase [Lawsonibacter sp.]|mgnify:FL=1|jgi:phosphotransferase system enzyme I (PtsI)|nr:phosphoenolpyruvate--protein phosphotransferase [Lawsonibacter sp.]
MMQIKGLAGAAGCVAGHAAVFRPSELCLERRAVSDSQAEIDAMEAARARYNETLRRLAGEARAAQGEEGAGIFEAYQVIAEDDYLFDQVKELIRAESVCASWAIEQKRAETEAMFLGVDDPYLQARAADINNVCKEITGELQGVDTGDPFAGLRGEDLIVFAEDLTPADTVRMDRARLKGMVTEKGGVTSHTVILAKALGIPAIVGVGPILDQVVSGQEVLVDGRLGNVVVCPDEEAKAAFRIREEEDGRRRLLFDACKASPARTKDGISVRVNINSGDTESINTFDAGACDGIGLFRTEFLYMGQNGYPSEDFQFNAYRSMAEKNQGRELIIRTLDIGGDKQLDYMDLPQESNPFLGYRAIRLCLDREEVFLTQLRAILRASAFGEVKIMFPMIVNLEELLRAKELLAKAMEELDRRGEAYHKNIPVGIMVETPAAVLLSDVLARHVDFFSIGSNDLIQYTTASDRMNEKVQYLYDSCNLSVLRSIKLVCDNARAQGVDVGICGETASEPRLIPLWCAMGVNELSVAPALVGRTKYIINQISEADMAQEMEAILSQGSIPSAREQLDKILQELGL